MSASFNPNLTDSLLLKIAPRYETDIQGRIPDKLWNAPFQFTIPVMGAMWFDLQHEWIKEHAADWKLQNNGGHKVGEMPKLFEDGAVRLGILDPDLKAADASKTKLALKCPIRAIAYFSWEESGRVFLARRVYPTFFNFLSYSHCPEGWGALGRMVKDLKESKAPGASYFTSGNFGITRISEFAQSALPFLSEVERLDYKAIVVIPVVRKWGEFTTTQDLLGGFVVFVATPDDLPPESSK